MMAWLDDTLAASQDDYSIVVCHHPIYSLGDKGPVSNRMVSNVLPILEAHNVDVYLVGHDHNMQVSSN